MDLRERVGHMLVLGTTRVGKTRLANADHCGISAGEYHDCFDPKGMRMVTGRMWAEAHRAEARRRSFMFFTWAGLISVPL